MGNFCKNHQKDIKQREDNELLCSTVGQQLIKAIRQRVNEKRKQFTEEIDFQNRQNKRIIMKCQSEMALEVIKVKQMIQKYYLGGFNGFRQAQNRSIEQIIGYQIFVKKLLVLEQHWRQRLLKCHQQILKQLASFEEKQVNSIHKTYFLENTPQNLDRLRSDNISKIRQKNKFLISSQISAFLAVLFLKLKYKYTFPSFFIQNQQQLDIFFQKMREFFSFQTQKLIGTIDDYKFVLF